MAEDSDIWGEVQKNAEEEMVLLLFAAEARVAARWLRDTPRFEILALGKKERREVMCKSLL